MIGEVKAVKPYEIEIKRSGETMYKQAGNMLLACIQESDSAGTHAYLCMDGANTLDVLAVIEVALDKIYELGTCQTAKKSNADTVILESVMRTLKKLIDAY